MPTDDNNGYLTNRLGLLELHRVGVTRFRTDQTNEWLWSYYFIMFCTGLQARKWHAGAMPYGKTWQVGDIVGCLLDIPNSTMTFSMNGELMMDMTGQEIAFKV